MAIAKKVTASNHGPKLSNDGIYLVYSAQFNNLVDAVQEIEGSDGVLLADELKEATSGNDILVSHDLKLQDGSASDPSLTFDSDEDVGLFRKGADDLGVAIGGSEVAHVSSSLFDLSSSTLDLKIHDGFIFQDKNGNEMFETGLAPDVAVNHVLIENAQTSNTPQLSAVGDDSNVGLKLAAKGSGNVDITSLLKMQGDGTKLMYTEASAASQLIKANASGDGGIEVSSDGMFKDPETDTEAGLITIDVAGTTYEIPFYASS